MSNTGENILNALALAVLIAIGIAFYFLPTIIGLKRRVRNIRPLVVLNVFGGWCTVTWIIAIVVAVRNPTKQIAD